MEELNIQIEIDPALYSKDPNSSVLGRKIIAQSINLIYEVGIETFTFKKLGKLIKSPESSVYRYFENKIALLIYLTSWYWKWTEYRIVFATNNVESATERLKRSIGILTNPVLIDHSISHVNEAKLSKIIFYESLKTYRTQNVDAEDKKGSFSAYKSVVKRVGKIITELNPSFKFPHMLITTIIEGAHQQKFFAQHLPALTDDITSTNPICEFYTQLASNFITNKDLSRKLYDK